MRLILMLAWTVLLAAGCGVTTEQAKQRDFHLDQGFYYFSYGRYPQAAHQYQRALTFDEGSYEAQVSLGYCYRAIGSAYGISGDQWTNALRFYRLADENLVKAAAQEDDIRIFMGRGWLFYDWAIAERRRVSGLKKLQAGYLESFPKRAASFDAPIAAMEKSSAEHLAGAEDQLTQALKLQPKNGFVLQTLGLALAQMGPSRYADAVLQLITFRDQSITLRDKAEKQLQERYAQLDDPELQLFKSQIANLKGHERKARVFLGWLYYSMGEMDNATVELKAVVALDPESPNQHLNLAHIYDKAGQHEKAVVELKKYIQMNQVRRIDTTLYTKRWLKERD